MASQTVTVVTDDIDGTDGARTISFALDGATYEIDLAPKNAEKLRKALTPYINAGRKVGGGRASAGRRTAAAGSAKPDPRTVRAWAVDNGYKVPQRGRIPASILSAYQSAG